MKRVSSRILLLQLRKRHARSASFLPSGRRMESWCPYPQLSHYGILSKSNAHKSMTLASYQNSKIASVFRMILLCSLYRRRRTKISFPAGLDGPTMYISRMRTLMMRLSVLFVYSVRSSFGTDLLSTLISCISVIRLSCLAEEERSAT